MARYTEQAGTEETANPEEERLDARLSELLCMMRDVHFATEHVGQGLPQLRVRSRAAM